jgi:hypothetical protein
LTPDEQNGVTEVQNNVISNIVSTLANIAPVGQSKDIHYASYESNISKAKTAMDNYTKDRNEILKYTQLK